MRILERLPWYFVTGSYTRGSVRTESGRIRLIPNVRAKSGIVAFARPPIGDCPVTPPLCRHPAVLSALALALGGTVEAMTRGQAAARLEAVASLLSSLAEKATGSAELGGLPGWAYHRPQHTTLIPRSEPPDRAAVTGALAAATQPRVRGLALLWLASARDPDDLSKIEPYLEATESAGKFPSVYVTQQVQQSYPVSWISNSLGDVALSSLELLLGRRFESGAAYHAWRTANPDLARSFDFWNGALEGDSDEGRKTRLAGLKQDDPEMFLRVLRLREYQDSVYGAWDDADVLRHARTVLGPPRLLALLRKQAAWPELHDESRFNGFSRWMLASASDLFAGHESELLGLWQERRGDVSRALAAARLNPQKSAEILKAALDAAPAASDELLRELTARHLATEFELIGRRLYAPDRPEAEADKVAVLSGAADRSALRQLALDSRFRARSVAVVRALVQTARRCGLAGERRCERDLWANRAAKGRRVTPADEARAVDAARRCLDEVRTWLRQGG